MAYKDEKSNRLFISTNGGCSFEVMPSFENIFEHCAVKTTFDFDLKERIKATRKSVSRRNLRFLINNEKRTLFLEYYSTKVVVKCHEEDDFNWKIGLGLALSNANAINERKAKWHRDKWFRTKENHKLDYEAYSNWVLVEYYKNDMEDLYNLEQRVNNAKDKEFINL